jgi:hypothetical protein
MKRCQILIHASEAMHRDVQRLAAAEHRSVSNYAGMVMAAHLATVAMRRVLDQQQEPEQPEQRQERAA